MSGTDSKTKKYAVITMDVEDWYQSYFMEYDVGHSQSLLDGLDIALEVLNRKSIKGSFFVVGELVEQLQDKLRKMDKAGVIGMSKSWAKEFARKGVPVRGNAVAPGYIMTGMLHTVPEHLLDEFARQTMLKRLGRPEEVANVIAFLASDEASYITGSVIQVNGGMRL